MLNTIHTSANSETTCQEEPESAQSTHLVDFRLVRLQEGGWRLHVMSARAPYWLHANHLHLCEAGITFDLTRENDFLRNARKDGFKTEYICPVSRTVL